MLRGVRELHPFILITYITIILIGLMVFRDVRFLGVALIILLLNFFVIGEGTQIEKSIKGIIIMSLVIIVLNPLFNHRGETVLFYFYNNPITLESVYTGILNALSLSSLLILFMLLNAILSMDGLLYLMTKVSSRWSMLIMISLNFVPALSNKIKKMQEVQKTKRVEVDGEFSLQSLKLGMTFIEALLNQSLEDAMIAADSMTARGFGTTKRTRYRHYHFGRSDWIMLIGMLVIFIGLLYGERTWLAALFWILLCLLPSLVEGREKLKWLLYQ